MVLGVVMAAFDKEHLLGTVTSTKYAGDLAWIGMMLIHPRFRRLGIGRCLLCRCVEKLRQTSVKTIKLDATPLEKIYIGKSDSERSVEFKVAQKAHGHPTRWRTVL